MPDKRRVHKSPTPDRPVSDRFPHRPAGYVTAERGHVPPPPPRVALVVGNSNYSEIARLSNPDNDAKDMSNALQQLGFEVTTERDATRSRLTDALKAFGGQSSSADVALVFYAGHGLEMNGVNYLVPVDARLEQDKHVPYEAITLETVLESTFGAALRVVILDACRNNPLARATRQTVAGRSISTGSFGDLNRALLGDETLVAYAAEAGTTAADGKGRNSPYTSALLSFLNEPLELGMLFRRVRARVFESTNGEQKPYEYQSLFREHYLSGGPDTKPRPPVVDIAECELSDIEAMADGGDLEAQRELGERYEKGRGVIQDHAKAVTWYRRAAERGEVGAQANLGAMYANGTGVGRDDAQAVLWFRRSAEGGGARGQNGLGAMYARGAGVSRDDERAVERFRLAAKQGYAPGEDNLGWMYEKGRGVPRDEEEAVRWYRRAAERGYAPGENDLGWMYEEGRGVPCDEEEAVRWYRRAAEQGHARGENNLGWMYEKGRGVPRDREEAVRWYRRGAEQGLAEAQYNLGRMYEKGRGVPQDRVEAGRWYSLAADQGHENAQERLNRLR